VTAAFALSPPAVATNAGALFVGTFELPRIASVASRSTALTEMAIGFDAAVSY
jgi:hypothetical protein